MYYGGINHRRRMFPSFLIDLLPKYQAKIEYSIAPQLSKAKINKEFSLRLQCIKN